MNGPRDRDESVERLLRQSLGTPEHGATDSCLDAEVLAAWTDGALSGAALEAAQLHVADCVRCQDVIGTLARIDTTVPEAAPVRSSRRWLAWLVPLTAAAAAVAIWVAVPGNRVTNRAVPRPPAGQDQVARLEAPAQAQAPPDSDRDALRAPSTPPETGAAKARRRDDEAPEKKQSAAAPASVAKEAASTDAGRGKDEGKTIALPAVAPPAPAAPPAAAAAATPSPQAERSVARSAVRAADAAAPVIVSPDPAIRWRILGSAVQRSANGGATWEAVETGISAELTAGAAPSASVCWLVGRAGVVLLTTDGRTWRRVTFPEMTDLSAVFTVDAGGLVASVSTVDGRTFVTTDAGVTWVSRRTR